jgi:hypothetical protein
VAIIIIMMMIIIIIVIIIINIIVVVCCRRRRELGRYECFTNYYYALIGYRDQPTSCPIGTRVLSTGMKLTEL